MRRPLVARGGGAHGAADNSLLLALLLLLSSIAAVAAFVPSGSCDSVVPSFLPQRGLFGLWPSRSIAVSAFVNFEVGPECTRAEAQALGVFREYLSVGCRLWG